MTSSVRPMAKDKLYKGLQHRLFMTHESKNNLALPMLDSVAHFRCHSRAGRVDRAPGRDLGPLWRNVEVPRRSDEQQGRAWNDDNLGLFRQDHPIRG